MFSAKCDVAVLLVHPLGSHRHLFFLILRKLGHCCALAPLRCAFVLILILAAMQVEAQSVLTYWQIVPTADRTRVYFQMHVITLAQKYNDRPTGAAPFLHTRYFLAHSASSVARSLIQTQFIASRACSTAHPICTWPNQVSVNRCNITADLQAQSARASESHAMR